MNNLTERKFNVLKIENIAVASMCFYAMMVYVNYVNSSLSIVQSLALYGFVGMGAAMAVLRGKVQLNQYSLWYLTYLVLSCVCSIFSAQRAVSVAHAYRLLVVFLITLAMFTVVKNKRHLEMMMASMVVGATVLAVYMYSSGMFDTEGEIGGRLGGALTGNANNLAAIYMFSVCAAIYFVISGRSMLTKLVFLAFGLLQVYVLMLSGGRKTFVVPIVVLYVTMLLKKDRKGKRHVILYTLLAVFAAISLYDLITRIPAFYETIGYRIESLVDFMLGDSAAADGSIIERSLMRERAMELWRHKPVFGHGLNMFTQIGGFNVYSHCNYTEILCNQGLVGFGLYYSFLGYLLISIIRKRSNDTMKPFFIAVMIGLFLFDYGAITYLSPIVHMFIMMICIFKDSKEPVALANAEDKEEKTETEGEQMPEASNA